MGEHLKWLWAMHRARLFYRRRDVLFTRRLRFMTALRPKLDEGGRIASPDAIFFVAPIDVRRAELEAAR